MQIITILIFLISIFFGTTVIVSIKFFKEKVTAFMVGCIGGLAFYSTLSYVLSVFFNGYLFCVLLPLFLLLAISLIIIFYPSVRASWRGMSIDTTSLYIFFACFILFGIISSKLLIEKDGGYYTGIINAYGDIAWHISNITSFAQGQTFPPTNPIFSDTKLEYPFMSNYFSSVLVRSGSSLIFSTVAPAMLLIPVLLTLLYFFVFSLTQKKAVAIVAVLLFIFGGATFGFTRITQDYKKSEISFFHFISHLPDRDYSGVGDDKDGYHFLNPATSLLLPQRPILFGMSLALALLLMLLEASRSEKKRRAHFIMAGILAGLIPLFHAHTVVVLVLIIAVIFSVHPSFYWMYFVIAACFAGSWEILYYINNTSETGSFFRWGPGWMVQGNFFIYWLKNTGFLFPVTFFGFFLPAPRTLKRVALASLILFASANIWLFAPWEWDNYKILVYWMLFFLPLFSYALIYILEKKKSWAYFAVTIIVIIQLFSGALDIMKISMPTSPEWIEWDKNDIEFAKYITENTKPHDIILTAPIHNSPVALSGRYQYLGYPAHVWSHGQSPWAREGAIKEYYTGSTDTLPESSPRYIVVGPDEKNLYPDIVIRPEWKVVYENNGYALYSIEK